MDNIINNLQAQAIKITIILQGQVADILHILHARGMDTTPYIIAYIAALVFLLFLIHKITHVSFAYIFIPTALFCLAGFFFYKHSTSTPIKAPAPSQKTQATTNYWEYRVTADNSVVSFDCEKGTPYSFRSKEGFYLITIDNRQSNALASEKEFSVVFPKPTKIHIVPGMNGVFKRTGHLEIWKNKVSKNKFMYLRTDTYDLNEYKVRKGDYLHYDGDRGYDYLSLASFKNGSLVEENLIDDPEGGKNFYFSEERTIKIKAAEVPFWLRAGSIEIGRIQLSYASSVWASYIGGYKTKAVQDAPLFQPGETFTTIIWLDKGDEILTYLAIGGEKDIQVRVGGMSWTEGSSNYHFAIKIKESGYLELKAVNKCLVGHIYIYRNKYHGFNLAPGQTNNFSFDKGDEVKIEGNNRFYLNGTLMDAGSYTYSGFTQGEQMAFKGSVLDAEIAITYLKRKGF